MGEIKSQRQSIIDSIKKLRQENPEALEPVIREEKVIEEKLPLTVRIRQGIVNGIKYVTTLEFGVPAELEEGASIDSLLMKALTPIGKYASDKIVQSTAAEDEKIAETALAVMQQSNKPEALYSLQQLGLLDANLDPTTDNDIIASFVSEAKDSFKTHATTISPVLTVQASVLSEQIDDINKVIQEENYEELDKILEPEILELFKEGVEDGEDPKAILANIVDML